MMKAKQLTQIIKSALAKLTGLLRYAIVQNDPSFSTSKED
jgi:hypothetical protein